MAVEQLSEGRPTGTALADVTAFSYAELPAAVASELKTTADMIRCLKRQIGADIVAIGTNLICAKRRLDHGKFGKWLKAEFLWSDRTARRFMQVAEVFAGKTDTVSVLEPTTLYVLSSPLTPETVRVTVIERLEHGEMIPDATVRNLVRKAKDAELNAKKAEAQRVKEATCAPSTRRSRQKRLEEHQRWRVEREASLPAAAAARDDLFHLLRARLGDDLYRFVELCRVIEIIDLLHLAQRLDLEVGHEIETPATLVAVESAANAPAAPVQVTRRAPGINMPDIPDFLLRQKVA